MNKITSLPHSRPSALMLIFGLYAVLCHSVFVLLYTRIEAFNYIPSSTLLFMLEHTAMSLATVFIGSFALDIAMREQKK